LITVDEVAEQLKNPPSQGILRALKKLICP
jgi:hypothetical protein